VADSGRPIRRRRNGKDYLGYDSSLGCGCRTRSAYIRKAPDASPLLAGQEQPNRAMAATVAGMPAAASFVALARPQVCGERVAPGVQGQVLQDLRPSGRTAQRAFAVGALLTYEYRPAGLRAKFHHPGTQDSWMG
jgi:hypothetical protein